MTLQTPTEFFSISNIFLLISSSDGSQFRSLLKGHFWRKISGIGKSSVGVAGSLSVMLISLEDSILQKFELREKITLWIWSLLSSEIVTTICGTSITHKLSVMQFKIFAIFLLIMASVREKFIDSYELTKYQSKVCVVTKSLNKITTFRNNFT